MAESLREQAIVSLVAALQGMTGIRHWGGAYPNAPRVERKLLMPAQATQFPQLCVVEGALDGPTSRVAIDVVAGAQIGMRHEMRVLLAGYVSADATVTAATWLQRLWFDCLKTLTAQSTLGGLVQQVQWGEEMETDEGSLDPVAAFVQPLTIIAHETLDTD
jgi:hypothetical protein